MTDEQPNLTDEPDVWVIAAPEDAALAEELQSELSRLHLETRLIHADDRLAFRWAGAMGGQVGVLIVSPNLLQLGWNANDVDAIDAPSSGPRWVIPIWDHVNASAVRNRSLLLADRVGIPGDAGMAQVARRLAAVIKGLGSLDPSNYGYRLTTGTGETPCPRCRNLAIHLGTGTFLCDSGCGLTFDFVSS